MGPLMTAAIPIPSAIVARATNSWGLTHRSIGWCSLDGLMYWVMVRISTPASTRSRIASSISAEVSPIPRMRFDLVSSPASEARVRTSRLPS